MGEKVKNQSANTGQTQGTQSQSQEKTSEIDIEAIKNEIRAKVEEEFRTKMKESLGVESFEELEKKKLEEEGKYKELLEKTKQEAESYRVRYEEAVKKATLTSLASQLGAIDVDLVYALLKDKSKVVDGKVVVEGKEAENALKELFEKKPYLVKASENVGSGSAQKGEADKFAEVKSYEDLLKDTELLIEFRRERPEEYKKLYEEYFNK